MFRAETREEAERAALKEGQTLEWLDNGDCKVVSFTYPAVRICTNGNKVFFNQVLAAYYCSDSRNKLHDSVKFADGT